MDAFVAAPKTYIVERAAFDDGPITTYMPVVGWVYVQGTVAFPICPLAYGGLTDKRAVLMPDGTVCDRYFDATFKTLDEWENACDIKGPINRSGDKDPDSVIEDRPRAVDELKAVVAYKPEATTPARKPKKAKTLQQKSFWGKKDSAVVLIAEGGTELPDDRDWMKITRDEFGIRKKDGHVVWPTEYGPGDEEDNERAAAPETEQPDDAFDGLV